MELEARPRARLARSRHSRRHHQDDAPGDERGGPRARRRPASRFMATSRRASVLGRLVERGLHDELKGTAYAIIEGVDGRTHHLVFSDLEMTGDAKPGAIVETRPTTTPADDKRLSLATRSDLAIDAQVVASGATWLDRQLLAKESIASCRRLRRRGPGRDGSADRSSRRTGLAAAAGPADHIRSRPLQHVAPARA